jgi:hypothetical protein
VSLLSLPHSSRVSLISFPVLNSSKNAVSAKSFHLIALIRSEILVPDQIRESCTSIIAMILRRTVPSFQPAPLERKQSIRIAVWTNTFGL